MDPFGVLKNIRMQEMGNSSYLLAVKLAGEEIFTFHFI